MTPTAPTTLAPHQSTWPRKLPGLALCLALAAASLFLGSLEWFAAHGLSALTLAIALGMLIGNTVYKTVAPASAEGVDFSRQTLLRAGVVLYGLRLTLQDIGSVGISGVLIDALVLSSTFGLAWLLGTRLLGMDRTTSMLVGAGSAICGAAAVMATGPVVRAHPEKVTVAVSTVVVFGTLAVFLYPMLYTLSPHWALLPQGDGAFGIYAGSTIHEVAQVVAAARSIGTATADTAVIAKMVRVMMLAPFLIGLSAWLAGAGARGDDAARGKERGRPITVPWFAFLFVAVVCLNSLSLLPKAAVAHLNDFGMLLLAMAMGALGLTTHLSSVRKAGVKPLILAALLFAWLVAGGALINHAVGALVG